MLTRKAVRWYFKNLFPHPVTEILLGMMILTTWYALQDARKMGFYEFEITVEMIFLPVYSMLVASHIFRSPRVTLFELSLFNGPDRVFIGRLVSALGGLLVGMSCVALVTYIRGYNSMVAPVALKLPTYLAIMMVLMVWMDSLGGVISLYILTSAVPMALFVLLTKPYPPGAAISMLAYFLSPIEATVNTGKLTISTWEGYTIALAVSLVLILLSYISFKMKDFEPQ